MRIFTTKAHTELIPSMKDVKIVGTMPHALIQQYNGCLVTALKKYAKTFPNEKLSALVDYHNDIVNEIKLIPSYLKNKIVSEYFDNQGGVKVLAKKYGISYHTIQHWVDNQTHIHNNLSIHSY